MGVKYNRDYDAIVDDLSAAIGQIDQLYRFFEMEENDWRELDDQEQHQCLRTLADDLFYGLGTQSPIAVGQGAVSYDPDNHLLKVNNGAGVITIIKLV